MGKATIYRRYRSKDELITAAVAGLVSEITVPDTGQTRGDLLALMRGAVKVYRGSVQAAVMPSLVEAMSRDAELARVVREGFLADAGRHLGLSWSVGSSAVICASTWMSTSRSMCSAARCSIGC